MKMIGGKWMRPRICCGFHLFLSTKRCKQRLGSLSQAQLTGGEGADVMPYPGTTPCKEIPTAEVCSGMTECRWDNGACESIYSVIVGSGNIVSPQFTEVKNIGPRHT